ncbi:sugar ABC transporter substrate-binding protein [Marinibaculum pumilum]|uniref:Sugar ABC transporter substrate-binding protein n=1 Tax=Marinibaculum pumilum TaxID=1766165 RepID=A0ABV7KU34_9PROT
MATITHVLLGGLAAAGIALAALPGTAGADTLADFNAGAARLFAEKTAMQDRLPDSAPIGHAEGRRIVVVPCLMAAEGCARQTRGIQEAGQALGWEVTVIDGQGDPSKMANAVQQAINLQADGLAIQVIDAAVILGPLKQARAAGIRVVASGSINAEDVIEANYPSNDTIADDGYALAAAAYSLAGNRLNLIEMRGDEFGACVLRAEGTRRFIDECQAAGGDCAVMASENFLVTDLATRLPQQVVGQVRRNPGFDVLWSAYDAGLNFMIQGLKAADLTDEGFAVGFDANSANLDIIRAGGYQKATIGMPMEWLGWAQVDALNRMFLGLAPNDGGLRSKVLTAANVPAAGGWEGDVDFRSAYRKSWGVE